MQRHVLLARFAFVFFFGRYALAAHALKQLSFKASRMHLANVCEVSLTAGDEGRTSLLGILYDELLREQWASMSQKVKSFNVEEQVLASRGLARCVHGICLFFALAGADD